ncbi:MAG TPA: hypothetical protein VGP93_09200, partial [Polyangiaceae bacterium]|nr:hypothetical protein [Polyangiaceae bacterium]
MARIPETKTPLSSLRAKFCALFALLLLAFLPLPVAAEPTERTSNQKRWTESYPQVVADVRAGEPLTVLVVVPLCDSKLIHCGGQGAGDPGSLDRNLYW